MKNCSFYNIPVYDGILYTDETLSELAKYMLYIQPLLCCALLSYFGEKMFGNENKSINNSTFSLVNHGTMQV